MSTLPKKLQKNKQEPAQSTPLVEESRHEEKIKAPRPERDRKQIFLSGCNSLVGHSLFQQMRNDDVMIKTGGKAHQFIGTLVQADAQLVPAPNSSIILLNAKTQPKSFTKAVLTSDIIVIDLLSGTDQAEAESIIKILRQPLHETGGKLQKLIVLSSVMAWVNTPQQDQEYSDLDYMKRVPTPKFQYLKNLENLALTAQKININLKVFVVCSGLPYGNGEANDIFYEFFRRAWLSSHPELAALPVVGEGNNSLPTIHVSDLAQCVRSLTTLKETSKQYFVAVDQCKHKKQKEIMQAISTSLGSGALKHVNLKDVLHEDWVELLTLNLNIKPSPEFLEISQWHCQQGITADSMQMLNDEFNHFRGLFPLKVFIGGPPVSGKTHFATKLAQSYGIPHLKLLDLITEAVSNNDSLSHEIKAKLEELKDIEVAAYEKTRKKKDPDLDRSTLKPMLPDELIRRIVRNKINSPACMNKGFIMDGYPKNSNDAQAIFLEPSTGQSLPDYPGMKINDKIVPQYVVIFEADDAYLKARAKEISVLPGRQENHTEAKVDHRLKLFREHNMQVTDTKHILAFFQGLIGQEFCLVKQWGHDADKSAQAIETETLQSIQTLCEQNGKPCCINLITEGDLKFLKSLEPVEKTNDDNLDEIDLMILQEEEELQRQKEEAEENAIREAKIAKEKKIKDDAMAAKLEDIRRQERDLLDQRSQPIRQYLMDNVVPHLTEGLIELCKKVPEDAIDHLANFLLERADLIDEQYIKKREEEIRLKHEQKRQRK